MTGRFERIRHEGDEHDRLTCADCGFIAYENPKIVVGAVVALDRDSVLLCRRAIEPRRGFWTIPAGYMELGETAAEGAAREAWEEAQARIDILERHTGRTALRRPVPMQPGDVERTWADVSALKAAVGFAPRTPLEEGLGRFVDWYRQYHRINC